MAPSTTTKTLLVSLLLALATTLPIPIKAQDIPFHDGDPNFLFVGNSYTSYNSLAQTTASILKDGIPEWEELLDASSYNPPGRSFTRHLDELEDGSPLQGLLQTNPQNWKWVVLQDQSQTPGFWEFAGPGSIFTNSLNAATELDDMVAATGGQTMFLMTWGRRERDSNNVELFPDFLTMQGKLTEGYLRYVQATSTNRRPTYVAPAGLVFQTIRNDLVVQGINPSDPGTLFRQLYQNDGSHPSVAGTYVAALTLYTSMTGQSPKDINWFPDGLDPAVGREIQDAVSRTVLETFGSGVITYPCTNAFPANGSGSRPPTTNAPTPSPPTTQPPTSAPIETPETLPPTGIPTTQPPTTTPTTQPPATVPPTPDDDNSNRGSITVTFVLDDYPSEVSWTMMVEGDEANPLFFQPYESGAAPGTTVTETFDNLPAGKTYLFKASDFYNDGVCCAYGWGSLTITDDIQQRSLFDSRDAFQSYLELDFEILPNGHVQIVGKTEHYIPSTWAGLEAQRRPASDTAWPGAMPSSGSGSVVVNLMLDGHPEDVSWTLSRQGSDRSWISMYRYAPVAADANTLESKEFSNLERGWYLFRIEDSQENGLSGGGFVSLTAPLRALGGTMGVAWGSDGYYFGRDQIYFRMERDGLLSYISWKPV